MVATPIKDPAIAVEVPEVPKTVTLEDYLQNPPERMEWVDGELVKKTGMTIRHSIIQGRLINAWRSYAVAGAGGEVLAEAPCQTQKQARIPDVAYMTQALTTQYAQAKVLPQSYPLIAEVVSPTDAAEEMFTKAIEYLESSCEEVWLIFPEARLILVKTQEQPWQLFNSGQAIATQTQLKGFSIAVDELLA